MPITGGRITRRRALQVLGAGALTGVATPAEANGRGRVFVRPENTRSQAERAVGDHGGTVRMTYDNFDFVVATVPPDNRGGLESDARVARVEDDGTVEAIACSDHASQVLWWGVDRIDADVVSETGAGVDIAVLDTGLDRDHCDLKDNIKGGHNCTRGPTSKWDDGNGHGSHCGGIAAATDNGIGVRGTAPGANLYGVKVLDDNGSGYWSWIVCGIDWCMSNGREILSMSLGADSMPDDVGSAISDAYDRGHLIIAAAGNDGNDGGCANNVGQPARHPDVIAVSATGKEDNLAGYSSTGPEVELAAPGGADSGGDGSYDDSESILSTVDSNGYDYYVGTSMACPHVTGTAALVAAASGGMTLDSTTDGSPEDNADIRAILKENAEDIGLESCQQGSGLVDAEAAVNAVGNSSPSVTWQNPANGDTVSGDVTLTVDASDSDGSVNYVEFYVDGNKVGEDSNDGDTTYSYTWNSTTVGDGDHTLTAEATDNEGATTSKSISVTVDNVDSAPSVSWMNPNDGDTVGGTVDIAIDADDDNDTGSDLTVEWQVDDGTWQVATYDSSSGNYTASWDSSAVGDGDHNLDARATDSSGNTSSEARITVTVDNTSSAPTVDTHDISESGSPNPHLEITINWGVSDGDGDLSRVKTTVKDADESAFSSSQEHSVSGSTASGTDEYKITHADGETADVTIYVEDSGGNSATHTEQVTE